MKMHVWKEGREWWGALFGLNARCELIQGGFRSSRKAYEWCKENAK